MKKFNILIFIMSSLFFTSCNANQNSLKNDIIPMPEKIEIKWGTFNLTEQVTIIAAIPSLLPEAEYLSDCISQQTGIALKISKQITNGPVITLKLTPSIEHPEGYQVHSTNNKIEIEAKTRHGVFNGIQSLLQLISLNNDQNYEIQLAEINDKPRFEWRGLHLDVCRHFYSVEYIKKVLDMAAMHKINVFHWHLTDDQGWRIEIKKYPKLTEIGAWRDSTKLGHMAEYPHLYDGKKYGGFYTHDEIREIVDYANARHIAVVPEIEMPGHAQAAIASYPELGCFNQDIDVMQLWGISDEVYCAGKESTFEFLEDVLSEVVELFPGKYIHIGGDECPKKNWKKCENCQKRILEEGLKDEHELQSYFIKRIQDFLNSKGKKLIGWDEILEGGLAQGATVMSWRGEKGGIEAAQHGNDVIMTPTEFCYFDFYQSENPNEPLAIAGLTNLEKVYSYNPIPSILTIDQQKHILGTQANVWTEYIDSEEKLEYMLFPRLCALSEVQWTEPENKDFDNFLQRMNAHYARMSDKKINYRVPTPEGILPIQIYTGKKAFIELQNSVPSAKFHYTIDGSEPTTESPLYIAPFEVSLKNDVTLKTATFIEDRIKSLTLTSQLKSRELQPAKLKNPEPGLNLRFFEGPFHSYKEISGEPILTQKANWLTIPPSTMLNFKGWIFDGYMQIKTPGLYLFKLSSDCGSALYIDQELVIDNDGSFYTKGKLAKVELQPGFYPITVKYFNSQYGQFVRLYYQAPGSNKMEVFPGEQYFKD